MLDMETLLITLWYTPWWVHVLFCFLVSVGVKASRTAVVIIQKMLIAPVVFTLLSLQSLYTHLDIDLFVLTVYVLSSCAGILGGFLQVSMQSLRVDRERSLIEIPGTWSVMVLVMIIFFTKYYFGYELSVDPDALKNTAFEVAFIGFNALCTGMFIGKAACFYHRLSKDPSVKLSAKA